MPSAASIAAKTPLRAAKAKAQPFHIDSSPARVSRRAVPVVAGDPQGVDGLVVREPQQLGGGQGRGDRAVGGVVPASGADAGGVAEPALDLVGDRRRGDPGSAVGAGELAGRHHGRPVVAGVRRLQRQIRVVAIEVADVHAVGERRPVGRGRSRRRSSATDGVPGPRAATRRAIVRRRLSRAPTAQPSESSSRRRASTTTASGRSSNRVASANAASRSARVSDIARPHSRSR